MTHASGPSTRYWGKSWSTSSPKTLCGRNGRPVNCAATPKAETANEGGRAHQGAALRRRGQARGPLPRPGHRPGRVPRRRGDLQGRLRRGALDVHVRGPRKMQSRVRARPGDGVRGAGMSGEPLVPDLIALVRSTTGRASTWDVVKFARSFGRTCWL